jgi:hypothetical protein
VDADALGRAPRPTGKALFVPVELLADAAPTSTAIVVHSRGFRVEGLDVATSRIASDGSRDRIDAAGGAGSRATRAGISVSAVARHAGVRRYVARDHLPPTQSMRHRPLNQATTSATHAEIAGNRVDSGNSQLQDPTMHIYTGG